MLYGQAFSYTTIESSIYSDEDDEYDGRMQVYAERGDQISKHIVISIFKNNISVNGFINKAVKQKIGSTTTTKESKYYTYTNGRLTGGSVGTVTYDAIGNPKKYRGYTMTWTRGGKLTGYKNSTFTYDGLGRRASKTVNGTTVTYTYDSNDRLIKSSDGMEYYYDGTGVIAFKFNSKLYLYKKDIQGNIIAILDNNGNKVVEYDYDAWGNHKEDETTPIGTLNPFRYRGYFYDSDTGLYYLQARYYDPEVGRFLNMDSTDYADPRTVHGLNLYAYCNNNPVMYIDPTGRFWEIALAIAAILLFTPVGGVVAQTAVSVVSYVGMSIGAIFDGDIRSDMNLIGWNPFNSDENAVMNSSKVSFYKGMPIFRTNNSRSGTYYAIFLKRTAPTDELKHERGHGWQSLMMGIGTYGLMIGLPSANEWSTRPYYNRPWEITADILGGASTTHTSQDISRGWWYFVVSNLFVVWGYLFLIGEY